MEWDWGTFWIVILIVLLVIALIITIWWFIALMSKRRVSHVGLYFDENFRKIINEWDLLPRDRVKGFKLDMKKRLNRVGKDLDYLEGNRNKLDGRIDALEKEMDKLEVF